MQMLGALRRRRVFNLVLFLAFAGLVFLLFQMFILQVLDNQSNKKQSAGILSSGGHVKIQQRLAEMKKEFLLKSNTSKDGAPLKKADSFDSSECRSSKCKQNQLLKKQLAIKDQNKQRLGDNKHEPRGLFEGKIAAVDNIKDFKKSRQKDVQEKDILLNARQDFNNEGPEGLSDIRENMPIRDAQKEAVNIDLSRLPRGVFLAQAQYYLQVSTFTCLHSKGVIPVSAINDDYCDCEDSSDEPGTNACPDSKFYCKHQLNANLPKWLPGSQVNDGICDCCDGSDEWMNVSLPETVLLKDKKPHYGLYQGPCVDRCAEVKSRQAQGDYIRQQGALLKQKYVQGALGRPRPDAMYGKDGAFLMLSNECFTRTSDKYEYVVCPFTEIRQKDGHNEKVIGRHPTWVSQGGPGGYRLQMLNGESQQCPGMLARMALLVFECSIQNQVLSVQETEICEYTIHFSTPAAC